MENLIIPGTKTKPSVNFDANSCILEIAGESYPENALEFFKPVYEWLSKYLNSNSNDITFNFKMIYFNTSSSKAILDILDLIENHYKKNGKISVNWYYEQDDEDIQESGEEFAEGLTVPYKVIAY
jgi:hypothetical protein